MKNSPLPRRQGFTFIELMVVVLLIAGLSLFAIPKFKEAQIRQASARSGQNLKTLNTAVTEWDVEHSGPPNFAGERATSTDKQEIPINDNSHPWCKAILNYVEEGSGIWGSPNDPTNPTYVYELYNAAPTGSTGEILRGAVQSKLNGDFRFEPKSITEADKQPNADGILPIWMNGYEDTGRFDPAMSHPDQL